jgi:translation initiation factor 2B subunit (eIF-2B alpha/beta/delta family)
MAQCFKDTKLRFYGTVILRMLTVRYIQYPYLQYKRPEDKIDYLDDNIQPLIDYTPPEYINRLISDIGVGPPGAILDEMLNVYG